MSTCVIGVGNTFRGDDAVGLEVVRLLQDTLPPDVTLLSCEGEPVSLIDTWHGYDRVVLVDAMRSGAAPGTIRRLQVTDEPLPPELAQPSTHLLGVADAVELARALGKLPAVVIVFAIEGRSFEAGAGLSDSVAAAAALVAASVHGELTER